MSCQGQPLPIMFVGRDYDHTVIGNYMKKKYLALTQLIGKPETTCLNFSAADFKNLIGQVAAQPSASSIKLCFASYCPTGVAAVDSIVQSGYKDLLTVVFVGMDATNTNLDQYFLIAPTGGVLPIPSAAAALMIASYQKNKVPLIQEIMYDAGRPDFVETRAIWYPLARFNGPYGFLKEMDCQGATGITAFIGSCAEDFTEPAPNGMPLKAGWQMTLIFELVKTITFNGITYPYHFDLEDTGGFGSRRPAPVNNTLQGGNTGNICPPQLGC